MGKLTKRPGKNNYEVQVALPKRLRSLLGTSSLYRSLGTSDKAEATRRKPIKEVEVRAEIASLMAQHFPDDENALSVFKELVAALKDADNLGDEDDVTDRDILYDIVTEWSQKQKLNRLRAYQGRSGFEDQRRIADEIEDKAKAYARDAFDNRLRISDLVQEWRKDIKPSLADSTREEYERAISRFLKWCRDKRYIALEQFNRRDVRAFVADNYHGKMGKTVNLALGALNSVWLHAHTIGWTDEPLRTWKDHGYRNNVRVGTGEKKTKEDTRVPFSFDDIKALLDGLEPIGFADIVRLGLIAGGGRSAELCALKPENVTKEKDGYWLQLPGTKTESASRRVPVSVRFNPFMERLIKSTGTYLVPLFPKKKWKSDRDRNNYINKELNRKRRQLSLPNGHRQGMHSTRYLFIELLEGAGVAESTAKLIVGHKRTDITFGHYSGGGLVDLRESVEKMPYPIEIIELINGPRQS